MKKLETDNRNLLLKSQLGSRNLDYQSSVYCTNHRTSNCQNNEFNDSNKKRKSSIQGDTSKNTNNNGRFDVSDQMPIKILIKLVKVKNH